MGIRDFAEGLSGLSTFASSAIGSGLLSFAAQYPRSCTGRFVDGTYSCTNVFGATTMSAEHAGVWGAVVGFAIGGLALLARSALLSGQPPIR